MITTRLFLSLLTGSFLLSTATQSFAQSTPIPDSKIAPEAPAEPIDFVFSEAPEDQVIGSETAPLTAIVYASVTCGHCGKWFSEDWPVVKEELVETGKLRFVLRALPTPPAQLSLTGFLMAECAPEEDYFDVVMYQMENQQQIFADAQAGKAREAYSKVGALAGLNNDEEINTCLSNPDMMAEIYKDGERANAAQVSGVPAFFISGEPYKGPQSAQDFIDLIDGMIAKGTTELPEIEPMSHGHDHDH